MWWFWLLIGSCIGSFLNVCIYRMPREQSLIRPRSRCPRCGHPIAWYDNLPMLSFLMLQGRCRHCRQPIPARYPFVELFSGLCTMVVLERFGMTPVGFVYLAFVYALIVVSFIDLEFQIIPDEISLGGLALGLAASWLIPALHQTDARWLALGRSLLGGFVGGGLLYATGVLGDLLFRKESMGGGDVKLLAMAGSILGWKMVALTFFLAPLLALIPGVFVLLWKRSHVIPYGPFLSLGLAVSLFAGDRILRATGMEATISMLFEYYLPTVHF